MTRARVTLAIVLSGLVAMFTGILSTGATASHVSPQFVDGNRSCASFNSNWIELKVEPPSGGTFGDGTLTVTITNFSGANSTFDWSSNIGVDAVFVKGGPGGNLYSYDPEETSDTSLTTPTNPNNGRPFGISHISFCYDAGGQQTPPPPPPPPTTPPAPPPPPPPPTEAPTVAPTVITPTPEETPAETPTVLPTRIASPTPEEEATPEETPTVLPTRITPTGGGELPFTGVGALPWAAAGSLLAAAGTGLIVWRKRS